MSESGLHDGRFLRIERMLGREGIERLSRAFVCVIGLGAVGSYATEALARAGVGRLRLVDFDVVRLSNINRQLYALSSTIGVKKCQLARARVLEINPRCEVEAMDTFVHRDTVESVIDSSPTFVVDAIDSFAPKVVLLETLRKREMPTISSMGAALRTDPTLVRVGPLSEVNTCPLAAKVRKALRKIGSPVDIDCVYSTERTDYLPASAKDPGPEEPDDTLVRGRKRRTLGSLPTLTGIFGLVAANHVIRSITLGGGAGHDKKPEAVDRQL